MRELREIENTLQLFLQELYYYTNEYSNAAALLVHCQAPGDLWACALVWNERKREIECVCVCKTCNSRVCEGVFLEEESKERIDSEEEKSCFESWLTRWKIYARMFAAIIFFSLSDRCSDKIYALGMKGFLMIYCSGDVLVYQLINLIGIEW